MMKSRFLAVSMLALITLTAGASAQVLVIGGGLAKDCFLEIESGNNNYNHLERLCTNALQQEAMTRTNRAATYVNRGIARMRAERYDAALKDYDSALSLEPDLGAAYLNRGAALIFMRDFSAAKTALDRAVELDSHDLHAALYNRAIAKEQSGDVTGAYYDFLEAQKLKPEWELVSRQLARFSVSSG